MRSSRTMMTATPRGRRREIQFTGNENTTAMRTPRKPRSTISRASQRAAMAATTAMRTIPARIGLFALTAAASMRADQVIGNGSGPRGPERRSGLRSRQREAELAALLDRAGDLIAGLQPDLLLGRHAEDDAARRAGEEDVARLQGEVLRGVADDVRHAEDHVVGVGGLPDLAVHAAFDLERLRIGDLIGRHQPGPDRRKPVAGLAQQELAGLELQIAGAEVVTGGVTEYVT